MALVVFPDLATAEQVISEIEVTANVEGGVGPVKLGRLALLPDGRWALAHPFDQVDLDWIAVYAAEPGMEISE